MKIEFMLIMFFAMDMIATILSIVRTQWIYVKDRKVLLCNQEGYIELIKDLRKQIAYYKKEINESTKDKESKGKHPPLHCSFCGKDRKDATKIIAGPNVYICNECVGVCNSILSEGVSAKFSDTKH